MSKLGPKGLETQTSFALLTNRSSFRHHLRRLGNMPWSFATLAVSDRLPSRDVRYSTVAFTSCLFSLKLPFGILTSS